MDKVVRKWGLLALILLVGLFFRLYKLDIFYIFNHDQDLYSWIVKDIFIDHHLRLIGQVTSIEGVFIGPLFYYLLGPFFILANMSPLGATLLATLIGLITIFSIYYVFNNFFNRSTGLIGALIYATNLPLVFFDRWVVPTQPTVLWSVWFLYVLLSLLKGNFKRPLILMGFLAALIWHIHVALLPLILLVPVAIILSRKKIPFRDLLLPGLIFLVVTLPFLAFEFKYNFGQTRSMLASFAENRDESTGLYRLMKIMSMVVQYFIGNFLSAFINGIKVNTYLGMGLISVAFILAKLKKMLQTPQLIILLAWLAVVIFTQVISKRGVSEYYLANLVPVALLMASVLISFTYVHLGKKIVLLGLILFVSANFYQLITLPDPGDGYNHKKEIVQFIKNDMAEKGYSCAGINYITAPGVGVGFRYMLWENKVNTINPGKGAPQYNIVIPCSTSYSEITKCSGIVGLISPPKTEFDKSICKDPKNQEIPMLGFTTN